MEKMTGRQTTSRLDKKNCKPAKTRWQRRSARGATRLEPVAMPKMSFHVRTPDSEEE